MPYSKRIDTRNPGCVVFLLDQSESMLRPARGRPGASKAQALADVLNETLETLINRCRREVGQPPRHYFDIALFRYGGFGVSSVIDGPNADRRTFTVAELEEAKIGMETRDDTLVPVWVKPFGIGVTPMCAALKFSVLIVDAWVKQHRESYPPIVINITDGRPTDDLTGHDAEDLAEDLKCLRTDDGSLLFFNVHIAESTDPHVVFPPAPVVFPSPHDALPDDYARGLFRMSSELPDSMRTAAEKLGRPTAPGSRGLACDADIDTVIEVLNIGTNPIVDL